MAMRSQVYEWDAGRGIPLVPSATGIQLSIFTGGFGNNIAQTAKILSNQFIVIEDIGVTPTAYHGVAGSAAFYRGLYHDSGAECSGPRAYIQVRINTTDYFLDPDDIGNDGIPGTASPYPQSMFFQPAFNLYPDVYVLPGQTWDIIVTHYNADAFQSTGVAQFDELKAFIKYTLYDGADAIVANRLLGMGISINPHNVDWYKRSLISGTSFK